jgi:hypothetical protein
VVGGELMKPAVSEEIQSILCAQACGGDHSDYSDDQKKSVLGPT